MGNLKDYAENELRRAGIFDEELYQGMLARAVLDLIEVFEEQGHSGYSASLTRQIFNRVADFQPLTPLTGEADEWTDHGSGSNMLQNNRCYNVFKDKRTGRVWNSRVDEDTDITFPYVVPN